MDPALWWTIWLFWGLLNIYFIHGYNDNAAGGAAREIHYSRETLLLLRNNAPVASSAVTELIPECLKTTTTAASNEKTRRTKRKRGCKSGIRQRLKKLKNKLPLPVTLLINAQSLRAKTDELAANVRYVHEYRSACVLAVTETWFDSNTVSSAVEPAGFSAFRADRDPNVTEKARGGGVCLLVKDEWCRVVKVREKLCTPDIELLCLSLRPYYLPREFPQIFFTLVYIHPKADFNKATGIIFNISQKLEALSPDAPKFILGDFNNCPVKKSLRTYYQYVDCHTRKKKTLDLCFGTVKDAYTATPLPPLGTSDHNVVYLRPAYRRLLEREKPQVKTVKVWDNESTMALQGCFDCTSWEVFDTTDINEQVEAVSGYINFCVDSVLPNRTFKVYSNDKPWFTSKLKKLIIQKRKAYRNQDEHTRRELQREIKRQVYLDKHNYKLKLEASLTSSNSREAWQGVKKMTSIPHKGRGKPSLPLNGSEGIEMANQLNAFFCRFESLEPADEVFTVNPLPPPPSNIKIEEFQVRQLFRGCNTRKSPGPDNISGNVLKNCADQLAPVFTGLFKSSITSEIVPALWKTAVITPVPKTSNPSQPSDFRPIALTSLIMKCFECLVKKFILSNTQHLLDPLQFAYQASRGVDDAIATLLHIIYSHLEKPKAHVKILFADFSSAFNTIRPRTLANVLSSEFALEAGLIAWIVDFLSGRIQQVKVGTSLSEKMITSIGSPQGCVLSPLLFNLYTNSCSSIFQNRFFMKYADDTALVSLLHDEEKEHGPVLEYFVNWCEKSNLLLNPSKTKEMCVDFRKEEAPNTVTLINGKPIQQVCEFKYLGIVLDSKLKWDKWTDQICTKSQQRMFHLKKLLSFNVERRMLQMFYCSFIESILSFCITCWFGNATEAQKKRVRGIITISSKLLRITLPCMEGIYRDRIEKKARNIIGDQRHPLAHSFNPLPSGRRYRPPLFIKNRAKFSFVPQAIKSLNNNR